jgi:hypothetical protein
VSIFQQAIGAILNNYADVIEGGTTWRGSGTAWRGIAGTYSNDPGLRGLIDSPLTATATGTTTTAKFTGYSWDSTRWVKNDTPNFYLLCTSATNASNVDAARKITGWNDTTKFMTTAAFPAATSTSDVFTVLQGFKRYPNQFDFEADFANMSDGFDRFFTLSAMTGKVLPWFGGGLTTYETTLSLKLRFSKYNREHDVVAAAFENLAIIRPIICLSASPDHRDGTYTQALLETDGESKILKNDQKKVVVEDVYKLRYRVNRAFA